jgi:DnaJ-class molecular chaperone
VFRLAGITPSEADVEAVLEKPYASRMVWGLNLMGLCAFCRGENDTAGAMCSSCAGKHRVKMLDRHRRRKSRGTCPYCGDRLGKLNWACDKCAKKKNEARNLRRRVYGRSE